MRVGGAATAVKTVAVTSNRRNKVIGGEVGRCGVGEECFFQSHAEYIYLGVVL
jgi:hypothetical protein